VEVLELLVYLFAAIGVLIIIAPVVMHYFRQKQGKKIYPKGDKHTLHHHYSGLSLEWRGKRHWIVGIKSTYDPAIDKLTEIKLCFGDPHILPTTQSPQVKEKPHKAS
jgi:hypothetical protein